MASGAEAGLSAVDALLDEHALRDYHLLPSVRGELLRRLYRRTEARAEFERAADMTRNARERELLLAKARDRSEEHTSELQSLMRISYAVFCLKKKTTPTST